MSEHLLRWFLTLVIANGALDNRASERGAPVQLDAQLAGLAGLLTPLLLDVDGAAAGNPLLTGKTVSLVHPAIMIFLFFATGYTGWLGLQWRCASPAALAPACSELPQVRRSAVTACEPLRRAREIPAEVKTLKAQLPKPAEGQETPSSPLTGQIAALEQARRTLPAVLPPGLTCRASC